MPRRPVIYFDTNIIIDAASKAISDSDWRRVKTFVRSRYRHAVSFITLKELLCGLAKGSDEYFEDNKGPLKVLLNIAPNPLYLPYPSCFALRTVLGVDVKRDVDAFPSEEVWATTVHKSVIVAPSKEALKSGIRVRNSVHRRFSFDLAHFAAHENRPQKEHAGLLEGVRSREIDTANPVTIAAWTMHYHGLTPYTEQCERLAKGMDAACRYSEVLCRFANDMGYDYRRHESDWGDVLQLVYLCDPSCVFVTRERDLKRRIQHSTQSERVWNWSDFLAKASG